MRNKLLIWSRYKFCNAGCLLPWGHEPRARSAPWMIGYLIWPRTKHINVNKLAVTHSPLFKTKVNLTHPNQLLCAACTHLIFISLSVSRVLCVISCKCEQRSMRELIKCNHESNECAESVESSWKRCFSSLAARRLHQRRAHTTQHAFISCLQ